MLPYTLPCLPKFPQGTPCFLMFFSHAPPCLYLGINVNTKRTRTTLEVLLHLTHPYLEPKLNTEKKQKNLFAFDFTDNSIDNHESSYNF
jgi:hypothetical protein